MSRFYSVDHLLMEEIGAYDTIKLEHIICHFIASLSTLGKVMQEEPHKSIVFIITLSNPVGRGASIQP
jgi:hypothetical protein